MAVTIRRPFEIHGLRSPGMVSIVDRIVILLLPCSLHIPQIHPDTNDAVRAKIRQVLALENICWSMIQLQQVMLVQVVLSEAAKRL